MLGGVFQFGYVIYMICRETPEFKSLPAIVRFLTVIAAPILLSPVIVSLYGAYVAATAYDEAAIERIRVVISSLKVAEVILESVPQLVTQWAAIAVLISMDHFDGAKLQFVSIATSTLAIVAAELKFVSIKRKRIFVSLDHPAIASLAPLGFVLLLALLIGTVGILTTANGIIYTVDYSDPILYSTFVINILTVISSFLIFIAPFARRYFIISRNVIYLLVATASAVLNAWVAVSEYRGIYLFHSFFFFLSLCVCLSVCLLIGSLTFVICHGRATSFLKK